jgi:ankyrin repeat protein
MESTKQRPGGTTHVKVQGLVTVWLISLLSVGLATAADRDVRLVQAAADKDRETVRTLLKQGVDANTARADGATALLWAAHWDDHEIVDLLLRARANVNAADDYGVTPLARACENATEAMVTKLLDAGADPNAAQKSGLTPLMIASRTGNVNVVKALLAHGAHVNAATTVARATPVMWALAVGHAEIVRVLVEGGADVRPSTTKGFTPLMFAARNGDVETARLFIGAGADVNELSADGTHVLPFAILYGQFEFALFLLEQGANPNGAMNGVRALHAAAGNVDLWLTDWYRRRGHRRGYRSVTDVNLARKRQVVQALLAKGADPNARIETSAMVMDYIGYPKKGAFEPFSCGTGDLRGATPLWVAAYSMSGAIAHHFGEMPQPPAESTVEVLKALLAAGADPHLATVDGTTPLMVAAGLGRATYIPRKPRGDPFRAAEEAVRVLVGAGADVNAVNEADFTALHGAAYRGLNEVVEFLVANGASLNARDFKGRTPYRLAEGSKQSFQFQTWPETAALLQRLGADTRLGVPGTVHERARDLTADAQRISASQ